MLEIRLDRLQAQVCSVRGSIQPTCKSPYEENSIYLFCLFGCFNESLNNVLDILWRFDILTVFS